MVKRVTHCLLLFSLFMSYNLTAQISFTHSNHLLPNSDFHSGVGVGIADMNEDGLDDIVRLDEGYKVNIEHQVQGLFLFQNNYAGDISGSSLWSMAVADANNDGIGDILGGRGSGASVMISDNSGGYNTTVLPVSFFAQCSNFADINNDGHLDLFICDDDAESKIFANDGAGNFTSADEWIDMSVNGQTGEPASGNYGSVWTDFDNDGDVDLYIAKCRQGVQSQTDPRRINTLYVNDGAGNYTEMADSFGLKIGWQSWTADFQDIDNDGDMDCFITNHDAASQILENDGTGHFTDITASTGVNVTVLPIQGIMRDFDNDGFVDIIVSGSDHQLFKNNGDKTFDEVTNTVFNDEDMESYGIGDVNHDGFIDVYASYASIYTNPTNVDDVLWLNNGNDNNYVSVSLRGKESNRNGVGARVEIHGEWGIQIREVRAGESYGISNSLSSHFGLASAEIIDSLIVRWPSGIVDKHENISANKCVTIIEGECMAPIVEIEGVNDSVLCEGETVTLSAPDGYTYVWSDGSVAQSLVVGVEGMYRVTITNSTGCTGVSPSVFIPVSPDETPSILVDGNLQFCEGESVTLLASEASSYLWSNGQTTQFIEVFESGNYSVQIQGTCEEFTSLPVTIEALPGGLPPTLVGDTISGPGNVTLASDSEDTEWFASTAGVINLGTGATLDIYIDMTTTFYAQNVMVNPGVIANGGLIDSLGNGAIGDDFFNVLYFESFEPFILKSVKVYANSPGVRTFQIRRNGFQVVGQKEVMLEMGENIVALNLSIMQEGDHSLGIGGSTDADLYYDVSNTGSFDYPYSLGQFGEITGSGNGGDFYYYFYDWEVGGESIICKSELVPVIGLIEMPISTRNLEFENITILPNPNNGQFSILLEDQISGVFDLKINDINGREIYAQQFESGLNGQTINLDIPNLAKGLYLVNLNTSDKVFFGKIIIQ